MLSVLALALFLQLPQEPCKIQDPTIPTVVDGKVIYTKALTFTSTFNNQPAKDSFLDKMLKPYTEKYNFETQKDVTEEDSPVIEEPEVVIVIPDDQKFISPRRIPNTWPNAKLKKIPPQWENLKVIKTNKLPEK